MSIAPENLRILRVSQPEEWRAWLHEHYASAGEIWLVFSKNKHEAGISYNAAVEHALCYGWIDSLIRKLDEDRYARKFTPRKPDSKWSTANRLRYADLQARGLLQPAGLKLTPTERDGDMPRSSLQQLPPYIEAAFRAAGQAWQYFGALPPSCRREYIARIDSAKREPTKQRRLAEAIQLLQEGKRLPMK